MTIKDIIKLLPAKYDLERKIGMVSGITIGQAEMIATLVLDDVISALSKITISEKLVRRDLDELDKNSQEIKGLGQIPKPEGKVALKVTKE